MGLLRDNSTVAETPLLGLRPVGRAYSVLNAAGGLLPGLTWERDVRGRHEGYSVVRSEAGNRWCVNDDGYMMFAVTAADTTPA